MVKSFLFVFAIVSLGVFLVLPDTFLFKRATQFELWLTGLNEHKVNLSFGEVSYVKGGKGPALLLIHGFGADKGNWTKISRHLTDKFTVIAIDLPGFGKSEKSTVIEYDAKSQAARVIEFMQAMGIQRYHVAGSSMGGLIASKLAHLSPQSVLSIWLLNPLGVEGAEESEMFMQIRQGEAPWILAANQVDFEQLLGKTFTKIPYLPGFVRRELVKRASDDLTLREKIYRQTHFLENGELGFQESQQMLLSEYKGPVLIMWGEDDQILHPGGADTLAKQLGSSSVVNILPDIGHLPMIEEAERSASLFLQFQAKATGPYN